MIIRLKFAKYGNLKYLSHLDVMRFFQKAVRRAEIDIKYSSGFHPHQIMTFAAPLGVAQTSEGEYFDMELNSECDTKEIMDALNLQMPEGFRISDVFRIPDPVPNVKSPSLMSLVKASDYLVIRKDHKDGLTNDEFSRLFQEFMNTPEMLITRRSKAKTGEVTMDIKPFIYKCDTSAKPTELTDESPEGMYIYMLLCAGNDNHVRPEYVLKAFYSYLGKEYNQYSYSVHRLETYTEKDNEFIPIRLYRY